MWTWACLVPHPPIILPEVGRGRQEEARDTLEGFRVLGTRLRGREPDVLLVLSPHAPWRRGISFWPARRYRGDLGSFGVPGVSLDMEGADAEPLFGLFDSLKMHTSVSDSEEMDLDHGVLVPMKMILPSFRRRPRLVLANPAGLSMEEALEFGRALHGFETSERWALFASGDLSHRLAEDGPYGFHPDGVAFDRVVREALCRSEPRRLFELGDSVLANAGQCGLQSLLVLLGLAGRDPVKLHSYESPFGVGYATASWCNDPPPVALARENLEAWLLEGEPLDPAFARARFSHWPLWEEAAGCFVSLKTREGVLRGCIGTMTPLTASLGEEILRNSLLAASEDPRFPPVTPGEWEDLAVSVDVLGVLEPVESHDSLDPRRWGVLVSHGRKRGVLLPDLPGVDTVRRQLAIAREKAGIADGLPFEVRRFPVTRYVEEGERP